MAESIESAVRRIHTKRGVFSSYDDYTIEICVEDQQPWPCATIKAIDAVLSEVQPEASNVVCPECGGFCRMDPAMVEAHKLTISTAVDGYTATCRCGWIVDCVDAEVAGDRHYAHLARLSGASAAEIIRHFGARYELIHEPVEEPSRAKGAR